MASRELTLTIAVRAGKLLPTFQHKQAIAGYLQSREGKDVILRLGKPVKVRSNNQNRYYHGVVVKILSDDTGHTTEEMHEILKAKFLGRKFVTIGSVEVEVTKSTTDCTTEEFEHYLEQIRAFAATNLGIRIPLPNGQEQESFEGAAA